MFHVPLRFEPVFQQYLWGGRRLESVLNKPIGQEGVFAESWEVVDHGADQSVVSDGPLKGKTLGELTKSFSDNLIGPHWNQPKNRDARPEGLKDRFPLLVKWLDANDNLSVQVHPDDELGATLDPQDLGKTEAWYIADAIPGSKVYAGLKEGVTQEDLRQCLTNGTILDALHSFTPNKGDCLFIPAGTIHALGSGLLVAEIQQASNTTYRLYDWDRVDKDGKSRPMHIEQAIQATNYSFGPVSPQSPDSSNLPTEIVEGDCNAENLVTCQYFQIDKLKLEKSKINLSGGVCMTITCTKGTATISTESTDFVLPLGGTTLVPFDCKQLTLQSQDSELLIGRVA